MTTTMSSVSNGVAVSLPDDSKFVAYSLIMKFSVSMALKAVLQLGIPDILATAEGRRPLSAMEILAQLPTKSTPGPQSFSNLRRLLNPLVREGLFSESSNGNKEPVYGLTEVSEWFIRSSEMSMISTAELSWNPANAAVWHNIHEAVLDETATPFEKTHGLSLYEYIKEKDLKLGAEFQGSMTSFMMWELKNILDSLRKSGVVDNVTTLVDVGGNLGTFIAEIVAQFPHIQGINFDLPYVIASAPSINGVEHVGGSFFEGVPAGDVLFLKYIIHNYGDERAIEILQNCFKALPNNGKVILAEYVLNEKEKSTRATFVEEMDLVMLVFMKEGRERTKEDYLRLLKAAGFPSYDLIQNLGSVDLIVGFKG